MSAHRAQGKLRQLLTRMYRLCNLLIHAAIGLFAVLRHVPLVYSDSRHVANVQWPCSEERLHCIKFLSEVRSKYPQTY